MSDKLAIAVDFGGTSIKIGVTRGEELVDKAAPLPTPEFDSPASIMAAMCGTMKDLLRKHPQVVAVGLGMPGWVDFHKGVLYQLTNVPVWNHQVPVREVMERELNLPVVLDNDANCMGYAEWKLGAGRGLESLLCLTLGTGIGGCIVVHNRMLRGRNVSAAELGQTSVDFKVIAVPWRNTLVTTSSRPMPWLAMPKPECIRRWLIALLINWNWLPAPVTRLRCRCTASLQRNWAASL